MPLVRPRSTRGPVFVGLTYLIGLLLVACSGTKDTNPDTDVIRAGSAFPVIETEEYEGDVGGQGFGGTLTLVDGCVGFGRGVDGVVGLFPPGTEVSGEGNSLTLTIRGSDYRLGDPLSGGTRLNEEAREPLTSFGDLNETAPDSCRDCAAVPFDPIG